MMRPSPKAALMARRRGAGSQLLSMEYLTKKPKATKSAMPPSQAKSFTPVNCSQSMLGSSKAGLGAGRGAETAGADLAAAGERAWRGSGFGSGLGVGSSK